MFVDREHFFDGFGHDGAYALDVVRAAYAAGAEAVVLCDTNGGMLPPGIARSSLRWRKVPILTSASTVRTTPAVVANTITAVEAGATHAQCTANGYGERTGTRICSPYPPNLQFQTGNRGPTR